ncbi:MAG: hypothetical protein VX684_03245, partial [Planctomycetota bacterium]|nr:hypothetical protein [Planctomycetota bacterium]
MSNPRPYARVAKSCRLRCFSEPEPEESIRNTTVCATLFTAASLLWPSTHAVHGDVVSAWSFNALDGEASTFKADTGSGTLDATSVAGGL